MANEDSKSFESSTKCWICDNNFVKGDVTVRDHCHISIEKTEALQQRSQYQRQSTLQISCHVSQSKNS